MHLAVYAGAEAYSRMLTSVHPKSNSTMGALARHRHVRYMENLIYSSAMANGESKDVYRSRYPELHQMYNFVLRFELRTKMVLGLLAEFHVVV